MIESVFLIIVMIVFAIISLKIGKILPREMVLVPLIMMIMMDAISIYIFKEFMGMPNKHISFTIMIATLFKVILLAFTIKE
jgi:hypothetical protein